MNLLDQARKIPEGVKHITEWLGSGCEVVSPEEAQRRADICIGCEENKLGLTMTKTIALVVRRYLDYKNKLKLRVSGEKKLGICRVCTCQLRLLVHEPQNRVVMGITDDELKQYPAHCWKIKDWKE